MLNMKKLIDETDFDNLNQLTKRWANSQKPNSLHQGQIEKQNDFKKSNENPSKTDLKNKQQECPENIVPVEVKPVATRKHKIVPQVIDQDTEHFKNKLENLLNNFKTDAVAEFMSMKKQMLEYQQECVKSDTQKYLTMYEQKHKQLLDTKQKLLEVSREAEKKTTQVQLLSDHIAKLNERMKTYKYVSRPFSILYENMIKEKNLKFKMKEAAKFDQKRLKRKSIWGWMGVHKQQKAERQKVQNEERIEREVSEIVGKFQKQMELLKQRLAEATRKNEQYENNKHQLQQNLKKAFLRGVCAMNMEAMGVLGSEAGEENEWATQKEKTDRDRSVIVNNVSYMDPKASRENVFQNQSMMVPKTNEKFSNPNISVDNYTDNVMLTSTISGSKAESKNYKWKQAPIMGVEENKQVQEPRIQMVRPITEGKVIKIVDGKSAVQVKKTLPDKTSMTGSRKKI